LSRINQSTRAFVERWNKHSLKLPRTSLFTDPVTGRQTRSIVPEELVQTHPRNYSRHGLLTFFHSSPDTMDELFGEHEDPEEQNLPQVEVQEALWELGPELLQQFQENFQPLTLDDSLAVCKERYKEAIRFIF